MLIGIWITAVALVVLLFAEWRMKRLVWLAKPIASLGFLLAAMHVDAMQSLFGRTIFLALTMSWLGDVLLIPSGSWAFLCGLGSFLIAHLGFAVAFAQQGLHTPLLVGASVVVTGLAAAMWRWLGDDVPEPMRAPVLAYLGVISAMVATAVASAPGAPHPARQVLGVVLFYLSDVAVAKEKFKGHALGNKLVGLPLYYAAQLCIASLLYF